MNVLRQLRKQMTVISNHRHRESIGGYRVYFVGVGERRVAFEGWWRTELEFYSMDAVGFSQRVRVNGREEFVREENMVSLFAERVVYEELYEAPRRFDDAWIVFQPCAKKHPLKDVLGRKGYRLFRDDGRLIRQRIHEVADIASPDPGARMAAQAALLQILAHVLHAHSAARGGEAAIRPLAPGKRQRNSFRERVHAILTENLRDDPSVEDMARILGVSRSTLSHRFSLEMGETLVQLKNRLRIRHAQELMSDGGKQIKEIAFEAGFDDPAYFTRIFTRVAGVSPGEYRKLAGPGPAVPRM